MEKCCEASTADEIGDGRLETLVVDLDSPDLLSSSEAYIASSVGAFPPSLSLLVTSGRQSVSVGSPVFSPSRPLKATLQRRTKRRTG